MEEGGRGVQWKGGEGSAVEGEGLTLYSSSSSSEPAAPGTDCGPASGSSLLS
jgi:hypothetical protein